MHLHTRLLRLQQSACNLFIDSPSVSVMLHMEFALMCTWTETLSVGVGARLSAVTANC